MDGPASQPVAWHVPLREGMIRGLAGFVGGLSLLNLLGSLFIRGFDANQWWIDLRPLAVPIADGLLAALGLALVLRAVWPDLLWRFRISAALLIGAALATSLFNGFAYLRLLSDGTLSRGVPVAFSWLVAIVLAVLLAGAMHRRLAPAGGRSFWCGVAVAVAGCGLGVPLGQMACFGNTDYRRPADLAVVFGARVHADGHPSQALADRVRAAAELYRQGTVRRLLMSGGPGDGAVSEPEAMKRLAISLGVAPDDILLDEQGLNTAATVRNTPAFMRAFQAQRVLAVSHFYHLPRIKMAYEREGIDVCTVPAPQSRVLAALPTYMIREAAAIWAYYLAPLIGG